MNNKRYLNLLCVCMFFFLSSCKSSLVVDDQITSTPKQGTNAIDLSTNTPDASKDQTNIETEVNCEFEKIYPANIVSELVDFSGDKPDSKTFILESDTTIRVFWNQTSKENFLLSGTNLDPNLADSPNRTLIFESFVGPSSGCVDATFGKGKYKVNIENADSNWEVAIVAIKYKQ